MNLNTAQRVSVSGSDTDPTYVRVAVEKFEKSGEKAVSVKSQVVRFKAAQLSLCENAAEIALVCEQALKDGSAAGRDHLVDVWGGTCEMINRLLNILDSVEPSLTDDKNGKLNDNWIRARKNIETIKKVLEDLGLFRKWTPNWEQAIENLSYSLKKKYSPGQKVTGMPINDGGTPDKYEIDKDLPPGLTFDPKSGNVSGRITCEGFPETTFTVTAFNKGTPTGCKTTFTLAVGPDAPSGLAYKVPPEIHIGEAAYWVPEVSGVPDKWEISPALPKGLELMDDGTISGIAIEIAPKKTYTVTATNVSGKDTCDVTFAVSAAPPLMLRYIDLKPKYWTKEQLVIHPELKLKAAGVDLLSAFARKAGAGGNRGQSKLASLLRNKAWKAAGVQFTISPALPEGVAISPTTGMISGFPKTPQDVTKYTVTAKNASGQASCEVPLLICVSAPENLQYADLKKIYFTGEPVGLEPSFDGVATEFTVVPSLPDGLRLDTQTGEISGVPTTVTPAANYTVTCANDMGKCQLDLNVEIQRAAPKNLAYLDVEEMYPKLRPLQILPTCEGEVAEFTISPALPGGVSFDPKTGIISGTPTEIKPKTTYTVTAKNETGSCDATLAFEVAVLPPTSIDYDCPPEFVCGEQVNLEPTLVGGADDFAIEPALPPGMTFDTKTGIIGGSPAAETPTKDYTVTATNEGGGTSTVITFAVKPLPPSDLRYPYKEEYTVQEPVTIDAETDNCIGCKFEISPALPGGMSIDPVTGDISGTPEAVNELTQYTVTATNVSGSTTATLKFAIIEPGGNMPSQAFCQEIDECTDIESLLQMEPDKEKAYGNWMVWMVHRVFLNDPSLKELNFSTMVMPLPNMEYRVAPKLMEALATNTNLEQLLLASSNLRRQQGKKFAEALGKNTTLRIIDVSSNDFDQGTLKASAEALMVNTDSAVEAWRFHSNGGLSTYGTPTEQALYELMKVNKKIGVIGCTLSNPAYRDLINRATLRNNDANRRARRAAAGAVDKPAVVASTKMTLKYIVLNDPPTDKASFEVFPAEDEKLTKIREFLSEQKVVPNSTILQNHMKKVNCSLKFSEVGPVLKDIRTKLLDSGKGKEVCCTDSTGKDTVGVLKGYEGANKNWKLDVMAGTAKRFSFETTNDPEIRLGDKFAKWMV